MNRGPLTESTVYRENRPISTARRSKKWGSGALPDLMIGRCQACSTISLLHNRFVRSTPGS